jgi:hypothetical protein
LSCTSPGTIAQTAAFQGFNRAVLVNLLITEVFVLYRAQFLAVIGLVVSLIVWAVWRAV